jgi:hypothetical protein
LDRGQKRKGGQKGEGQPEVEAGPRKRGRPEVDRIQKVEGGQKAEWRPEGGMEAKTGARRVARREREVREGLGGQERGRRPEGGKGGQKWSIKRGGGPKKREGGQKLDGIQKLDVGQKRKGGQKGVGRPEVECIGGQKRGRPEGGEEGQEEM